jgi:hypothetical protein
VTAWLLLLTSLYFLFGATMYVGTMWVLKFFLYPTWRSLTRESVGMHFGTPTLLATKFFTIVVPPMLLCGIVLIVWERHSWLVILAVLCLLGIVFLTFIGQRLIIPINKRIRGGDYASETELRNLLIRWMKLNDLRFYGSTATWLVIVGYLVAKGDLLGAFR